jgi:hypothetical protein
MLGAGLSGDLNERADLCRLRPRTPRNLGGNARGILAYATDER